MKILSSTAVTSLFISMYIHFNSRVLAYCLLCLASPFDRCETKTTDLALQIAARNTLQPDKDLEHEQSGKKPE